MSDLSIPEPVHYPQALDIQHDTDPEPDHGIARRIPHLGHTALFLLIFGVSSLLCTVGLFVVGMVLHPKTISTAAHQTPTTSDIHTAALGQLLGYLLTFAIAIPVFPLLWHRGFFDGISWTFRAARLRWWKLILLGFGLSILVEVSEHFIKTPKETDLLKMFDSPLMAWLTAIGGAFIAPIVEEIAFRGFLLPSLATAYDWLSLERTPAAKDRWHNSTGHTPAALVLASIVSSALFAALHGFQLHWSIGILAGLFIVSLVLSAVRVRFNSVAASSLVHISYNSLLFLQMIFATGGFRHLDRLTQ
jgi:membrane protease YdiL (CAAX protease family)